MRLGWLDPFRGLRNFAASVERSAYDLRVDTLSAIGTALSAFERRVLGELRTSEKRVLDELAAIRAEQAEFRAMHGFVDDPVAARSSLTTRFGGALSGDPTRPFEVRVGPTLERRGEFIGLHRKAPPAGRDERLPPGRHHP